MTHFNNFYLGVPHDINGEYYPEDDSFDESQWDAEQEVSDDE